MAVSAKYRFQLEVTEGLSLGIPNTTDPNLVHSFGNTIGTLTGTSTPGVDAVVTEQVALTAGAASLDLTALTGPYATSVDMSGKKIQLLKFMAALTNTDRITVDPATVTPYLFAGGTAPQIELGPGEMAMFYFNEGLADVSSTSNGLKFASSDVDAIMDVLICAG